MTKQELIDALECSATSFDMAADNLRDVGAFLEYRDNQEEEFWSAYDLIRFELAHLNQTIAKIKEQV